MSEKIRIEWCEFHNVSMVRCNRTASMRCNQIQLTKEEALVRAREMDKSNKYHLEEEVKEYFDNVEWDFRVDISE